MKSWRIAVVLLLCLVLAGTVACSPFGGAKEEISQQLVEVVRGDLTVSISGSGNIDVSHEARLAFGVGGRIDKIYVEESDEVSEGNMLAKLDTSSLELSLAQAEVARVQTQAAQVQAQAALAQAQAARVQTQAAQAQAQAARIQAQITLDDAEDYLDLLLKFLDKSNDRVKLAESQLEAAQAQLEAADLQLEAAEPQLEAAYLQLEAAQTQVELTELQLEVSELALAEAQKQLDESTIIAPLDGVVAGVYVDEGNTVSTVTTIFYLIDLTSMELEVEVDEIDIPDVKSGQRAIIELDALPDLQIEGEVASISLLAREEAGLVLYEVKIGFDIPADSGLRAGMSATADIVIDERSNVLLVPDRAIKHDSQGNPVVVVMVNEQIEGRLVVIGISDGFETEIVDGLEEGDVVVIETKVKSTSPGFFSQ